MRSVKQIREANRKGQAALKKRRAKLNLYPATMFLTPDRKLEFETIALSDRRAIIEKDKKR